MKTRSISRSVACPVALISLAALACSSQAGPDYEGESLMTLRGRVVLDNPAAPDDLVPVLVFPSAGSSDGGADLGHFQLVDGDVQGSFPSSFTLNVRQPPKADGFVGYMIFGYVAAVPRHHAKQIDVNLAYDEVIRSGCLGGAADGGLVIDGGAPGVTCMREYWRCEKSHAPQIVEETTGHCYHDVYACDPGFTHCVPDHAWGDPTYAKGIWQSFAGLSRNYMVLFTTEPPHGHDLDAYVANDAWKFNGGKPIHPGYHLLAATRLSDEDAVRNFECSQSARADAVVRYNAKHGTSFTFGATMDGDPLPSRDAEAEVLADEVRTKVANGCRAVNGEQFTYRIVASGPEHPLVVDLSAGARPSDDIGPYFLL